MDNKEFLSAWEKSEKSNSYAGSPAEAGREKKPPVSYRALGSDFEVEQTVDRNMAEADITDFTPFPASGAYRNRITDGYTDACVSDSVLKDRKKTIADAIVRNFWVETCGTAEGLMEFCRQFPKYEIRIMDDKEGTTSGAYIGERPGEVVLKADPKQRIATSFVLRNWEGKDGCKLVFEINGKPRTLSDIRPNHVKRQVVFVLE